MVLNPYLSPCTNLAPSGSRASPFLATPLRETVAEHINTSGIAEVYADLEKTEWLEPRLLHHSTTLVEELGGKKVAK